MIEITDVVSTLTGYIEAQRQLEQCRQRASGNADYYAYSYVRTLAEAEAAFRHALDGYVDQRVAAHIAAGVAAHPALFPAEVVTAA